MPIRFDFAALIARGNITSEELDSLRGNTEEWESVWPALSNEALCERALHHASNMQPLRSSYEEAVKRFAIPELVKRIRELESRPIPQPCEHGSWDDED